MTASRWGWLGRLVGAGLLAALLVVGVGARGTVAAADACVSVHGVTPVQQGTSTCASDADSVAVATNGADAEAFHGSRAEASGAGSTAFADFDSAATATNGGNAEALHGSTATASGAGNVAFAALACRATVTGGKTVTCP